MNFQSDFSLYDILEIISDFLSSSIHNFYQRLFPSFLILVFIIFLRFLILRFLRKKYADKKMLMVWKYNSTYISIFVAFLFLLPLWISSLREVLAFLGIFGAGVLIVFKEVLLNIAAWFYLKIRRPFEIGNRVTVNEKTGDVFEMRLMDFSMIEVQPRELGGQSTGRILHMPNSTLLTHTIANASKEFSFNWNEVEIMLTMESDWKKAEQIVLAIAKNSLKEIKKNDDRIKYSEETYSIQYARLTPFVFVEVKEGRIVLNLRHLTEPRKTRVLTNTIWREILLAFAKEKKIELAPS